MLHPRGALPGGFLFFSRRRWGVSYLTDWATEIVVGRDNLAGLRQAAGRGVFRRRARNLNILI